VDFYTYKGDIRPFGHGSPIAYKYAALTPDIEQGEMAAWNATGNVLVRWQRSGAAGKFVGITRDSAKAMAKLGNQPALALTEVSVFTTGIHEMLGTAAEVYGHGEAVYMNGTDTTKIIKVAGGGVQVGTVHLPLGNTLTGAVRVPILIDEYTKVQE